MPSSASLLKVCSFVTRISKKLSCLQASCPQPSIEKGSSIQPIFDWLSKPSGEKVVTNLTGTLVREAITAYSAQAATPQESPYHQILNSLTTTGNLHVAKELLATVSESTVSAFMRSKHDQKHSGPGVTSRRYVHSEKVPSV